METWAEPSPRPPSTMGLEKRGQAAEETEEEVTEGGAPRRAGVPGAKRRRDRRAGCRCCDQARGWRRGRGPFPGHARPVPRGPAHRKGRSGAGHRGDKPLKKTHAKGPPPSGLEGVQDREPGVFAPGLRPEPFPRRFNIVTVTKGCEKKSELPEPCSGASKGTESCQVGGTALDESRGQSPEVTTGTAGEGSGCTQASGCGAAGREVLCHRPVSL